MSQISVYKMFRKPYKVKTSTTMKGSDRRMLRNLVENKFPSLSQEDINNLIPNKSEMNQVKAMTHAGRTLMVYCSNSNPVFFLLEDVLYPTIYTLWKYTNLLPTITTVPPVLEKICNGADLMAPGVIADEQFIEDMRNLKERDICAVRIFGNRAPIAVGVAIMSLNELCTDGIKGKAVNIIHNFKDNLWSSGSTEDLPIMPELPIVELSEKTENMNIYETSVDTEQPDVAIDGTVTESAAENESSAINEGDNNNEIIPAYTMDEILFHAFMTSLKVHGKKIQLPLLTSTFYSSFVLKSCPSELNLDIKKTSHKKLSVFLKKMSKEGIVQIKELTKGVESIIAINLESEMIKLYKLDFIFKNHLVSQKMDKEKKKDDDTSINVQDNYKFPTVVELFVVSAQVKKLFEAANIKKGESLLPSTVRDVIKSYVKNNDLQHEKNPREVVLDPLLSDCALKRGDNRTTMNWEEIYEAIVRNMPHAYQITFDGKEPILKKGKLEPIKVTIDTRTGNKKVTLIQNLDTFGINPEKIAHHVQVAVAASTSITPTPGGKGNLVLIQGNQVLYLQKLFLDVLKVPRKFITGLENIPKKK